MKQPKSFKWKDLDKFFKQFYKKIIVNDVTNGVAHRAICWLSYHFDFNEFYYQFGCPGLWWHGYLPIEKFGEPLSKCYEEDYPGFGYYEIEIKTVEDLQKIMKETDKSDKELNRLEKVLVKKYKDIYKEE